MMVDWSSPCLSLVAALMLGTILAPARAHGEPMALYVAPAGNDAWSGSLEAPNAGLTDGPLATIDRARDVIRELKAQGPLPAGGVTVVLKGGTYERTRSLEIDAADSGTPAAPIVYRAAPGEEVCLTGGRRLPEEAFRPVTDPAVLQRLDPAARGKVLQVDLKALGIPVPDVFPVTFHSAPPIPGLFFNGRRMELARWPNEGWTTIAQIIETGSRPRDGDDSGRPGVFTYDGDRPARWRVADGIWLQGYWCYDWYDETIQVKAIDPAQRRITLAAPHLYSVMQGNPSPRRFRALNLLEELDSPGEYYIDHTTGLLLAWPPGDLAGARVVLSALSAPVVQISDAENVTVRGLTVETSQGDGIAVTGGSANRVQACEVRNVGQIGVRVTGGTGHRVEACDIYDTGTGGLVLSGGDRKTLTPAGHEAQNNHIHDFSRLQLTYANAVVMEGVGNRAAHNLISGAPHQAIGISGNDHIFEYNIVHDVCTATDDCGAYYKGRNPSCRGNIVRYNFWYNIGSPMGHGNAAVYFDDGDGGDTVVGNVFFRCGEPGQGSFGTVFSHGGHDNLAQNNIFVECKRALGSAPWDFDRWKDAVSGGQDCFWKTRLLEEVDITRPPYTTRYPELVGFMDPQPDTPRINRAVRNAIVMCGDVKGGNWQCDPAENWVTDHDPGFVDAARGNFALRPDSEVFTRLPGFEPIPFDKIGLYADELRPLPPVEAWTCGPPRPLPPLGGAAAVTTPPKGPPPVFSVARAAGVITVDGVATADEWSGLEPAKAMPLAQDVNGAKTQRQSLAWLSYDEDSLFVAVDNTVDPDTALGGTQWGTSDAVEVSLRSVGDGPAAPIWVLRGYPGDVLQVGSTPSGAQEPAPLDAGGIQFAVGLPERGRWVAEFGIPFKALGLVPSQTPRLAFNITVRKTRDNLWLMWEGTRGHSYDVSSAGFIEFAP